MKELEKYNRMVEEWDFDSRSLEEFLGTLSQRNSIIKRKKSFIDFYPKCQISSRNVAFIDMEKLESLEGVAFHVGLPNQRRLYPLVDDKTGNPGNEGVFFSLSQRDVAYFSDFRKEPELMIYLLDSTMTEGVRMQANYDKSAISRYDLENLDYSLSDSELRKQHAKLNNEWVKKNTVPFDITKKDYEWLIVPAPIDIE